MTVVRGSYDERRRAELGAFLRARREEIRPADVGLAPGPRRRTPGLRREEVAQLAGVGVTWYTWLEQGRPINVSTQVLDAIARVLGLGSAERWHLYRLAEVPGVAPTTACAEPVDADAVGVLNALSPTPATVYNGKYDLIAWNDAYAALFPFQVRAEGMERNALHAVFRYKDTTPICDPPILEHMVAVARANYARHVGEPEWEDWVAQMCELSSDFADCWATHRVAVPMPLVKSFRTLDGRTIDVRTSSYSVMGSSDYRMVVYMPNSACDAEAIAELLRAAERASA